MIKGQFQGDWADMIVIAIITVHLEDLMLQNTVATYFNKMSTTTAEVITTLLFIINPLCYFMCNYLVVALLQLEECKAE